MHTLAFVNQKGGCGKTTTAVNLAGALARGSRTDPAGAPGAARPAGPSTTPRERSRVLVVDLDPQAHATLALGCAVDGDETIAFLGKEQVGAINSHRFGAVAFDEPPAGARKLSAIELFELSRRLGSHPIHQNTARLLLLPRR